MSHESMFGEEWSASREEFDRQIAQAVAAEGCRHCGGPLHQGNYERKGLRHPKPPQSATDRRPT